MAEPIIRFGRHIPSTLQEWDQVLRDFAAFVQKAGDEFILSTETVLPTNETLVDGVRAFMPPPSPPPPSIESQMMTIRSFDRPAPTAPVVESLIGAIHAFSAPSASQRLVDDAQAVLMTRIFGG